MFLTAEELRTLTGYKRGADQCCTWLAKHGYKFEKNALGLPIVSRSHAEKMLGGESKATQESDSPFGSLSPLVWLDANKSAIFKPLAEIVAKRQPCEQENFPDGSGVYFLFTNCALQYVGQSRDFSVRLGNHLYPNAPSVIKAEWLTHFTAIQVPHSFLTGVEYLYINAFDPPKNIHKRPTNSDVRQYECMVLPC